MDARTTIRSLIVTLVGLGLVVLVIVLLVKGFTGGPKTPTNRIDVSKYTYNAAIATLLVDGPTNLNQLHYQARISVSGTENEVDVIQGYEGGVIRSQTYPNNSAAFGAFLQSLQRLNFSKGIQSTADQRGFCPSGQRYTYSFTDGQNTLFSYWSTSCGSQGTFQGNAPAVRDLFAAQTVPADLNRLLSGTGLSISGQ